MLGEGGGKGKRSCIGELAAVKKRTADGSRLRCGTHLLGLIWQWRVAGLPLFSGVQGSKLLRAQASLPSPKDGAVHLKGANCREE